MDAMRPISFAKLLLAFLIFPFMAYEGFERGATFGSIDESQTRSMLVMSVTNANGRTIFPDYQARGSLPSGEVTTVDLFKREFNQLRPGDKLAVIALPTKTETYITVSKLEESKPFIRLGSFTVTWHFPVAVVGEIVLGLYIYLVWLDARRGKAT